MLITIRCSPMIEQFVDTMTLASTSIEWLKWPINSKSWKVLETVTSHLNSQRVFQNLLLLFCLYNKSLYEVNCVSFESQCFPQLRLEKRIHCSSRHQSLIMVIELSGVQFGLKSYAWFQNRTSAQREFDLTSQVWFQTKIALHSVQLPLY